MISVDELRKLGTQPVYAPPSVFANACREAADEIERLQGVFSRSVSVHIATSKALQECQKLLCPEFGDCADNLKDGELCACGFEDGPWGNAVPKNRAVIDR